MDESLFLILCLPWIILLLFSPPLSSTCLSRRMSIRNRFPSFFFYHISWGHLEEIVLSIHPLSISSLLTAVFFSLSSNKNNQILFLIFFLPFLNSLHLHLTSSMLMTNVFSDLTLHAHLLLTPLSPLLFLLLFSNHLFPCFLLGLILPEVTSVWCQSLISCHCAS